MLEMFSFESTVPIHVFAYQLQPVRAEQHWHSFYEVGYCVEGTGTFFMGEQSLAIRPGSLVIFPPYQPHIAMADSEAGCHCIFMYFSEALLPEEHRHLLHLFLRPEVRQEVAIRIRHPQFPPLAHWMVAMLDEYESRPLEYGAFLRGRMLELCVWLYRSQDEAMPEHVRKQQHSALERLKPVLDRLAVAYAEPLELRDVAAWIGVSSSRARHLFVEGVGKRFKEYLTFVRIQEAKRQLAIGEQSVTDIYLSCGFQSAAPFYRSFRQLVGMSPQRYRERQR